MADGTKKTGENGTRNVRVKSGCRRDKGMMRVHLLQQDSRMIGVHWLPKNETTFTYFGCPVSVNRA